MQLVNRSALYWTSKKSTEVVSVNAKLQNSSDLQLHDSTRVLHIICTNDAAQSKSSPRQFSYIIYIEDTRYTSSVVIATSWHNGERVASEYAINPSI